MTPDLVERVARAIAKKVGQENSTLEPENGNYTIFLFPWEEFAGQARAAIAIVLDEAETACRKRYMGDNNREDDECRACAAAIRALKGDE